MKDEASLFETLHRSLHYRCTAEYDGIYMRDDVGSEYRATGLFFGQVTDQ